MTNLERLRELTEKLSLGNLMPSYATVTSGDGRAFELVGLFKDESLAVLKTRMEPGMTVESHAHLQIEVLVIASGSATVSVGSRNKKLKVGESIALWPGDIHRVTTDTGADMVCITIPAAKEYPDARKQ